MTSKSASVICAYWPGHAQSTGDLLHYTCNRTLRVGIIQYFMMHTVHLACKTTKSTSQLDHLWAFVAWKKAHDYSHYFGLDCVVSMNEDEPMSAASFIPVSFIYSRCAYANTHAHMNTLSESLQTSTQNKVFVAIPVKFDIIA